jgi:hypothetical protein
MVEVELIGQDVARCKGRLGDAIFVVPGLIGEDVVQLVRDNAAHRPAVQKFAARIRLIHAGVTHILGGWVLGWVTGLPAGSNRDREIRQRDRFSSFLSTGESIV